MKDLLLCIYVVVKTLNLEISCCHLAATSKNYLSACHKCSTIILPHSTNQMFSGVAVAAVLA